MAFRYTLMAAVAFAVTGVAVAQAQSPFPPAGQEQRSSPFPPAATQALPQMGMPGRPQQQQQQPPCFDQFMPLREEVDKRFQATKATMDRKGSAAEMCTMLTKFTQAEVALIKFVEKNAGTCPFPQGLLENIKGSNVKSEGYRKQACAVAAAPQRPARAAEPTLSDALSPPPLTKDTTSTGRGTLDSLSGNPLAR